MHHVPMEEFGEYSGNQQHQQQQQQQQRSGNDSMDHQMEIDFQHNEGMNTIDFVQVRF